MVLRLSLKPVANATCKTSQRKTMFDIIALVFLVRYIGKLATQKGLKPLNWKIYTVAAWFAVEIIGVAAGVLLLHSRDLLGLQLLAWICGVGSFLFIRSVLQNKPDPASEEDINRISVDDLKP